MGKGGYTALKNFNLDRIDQEFRDMHYDTLDYIDICKEQ